MKPNDVVSSVSIYGLLPSVQASKFPMSTDTNTSPEPTETTYRLAQCDPGSGHDQFLTGIVVQFNLTLTNKAWVEAERYHFLDFVSSQSTMHRIAKFDLDQAYISYVDPRMVEVMKALVAEYNSDPTPEKYLRVLYSNPAGFRLTARMTTNYRQLKTIYRQRRNHRLPEWRAFCEWIETLPYSEWITCLRESEEQP
jgi:hypothetical protein